MHFDNIQQLLEDERFKKIIWQKQRIQLIFSTLMTVLFFGFVLVIAFAPSILSSSLRQDGTISLYVLLAILITILVCVLMNIFVYIKVKDKHEDIHALLKQLREEGENQ